MAHRNNGVYEPEFRLVLMVVVVVLGTVGFYGFGATVHYQTHWIGPVLTYGFANMALAFASTCVFGYVLDSYPRLAEEAFVAINTRNLLTFGLVSSPVLPCSQILLQKPRSQRGLAAVRICSFYPHTSPLRACRAFSHNLTNFVHRPTSSTHGWPRTVLSQSSMFSVPASLLSACLRFHCGSMASVSDRGLHATSG